MISIDASAGKPTSSSPSPQDRDSTAAHRRVDVLAPLHRRQELRVGEVLGDAEIGDGVDVGGFEPVVPRSRYAPSSLSTDHTHGYAGSFRNPPLQPDWTTTGCSGDLRRRRSIGCVPNKLGL
jgi:hypothetical protein